MAEQGTAEWLAERAGCATASGFIDIIAVGKNGAPLKARSDYLWQLATERIYAAPAESITAKAMQWGKDLEPFAREAYEIKTGLIVNPSGFVLHPTIPFCGASPDGLVGAEGGIEIKCPKDRTVHMQTWRDGMPVGHKPQVQGNIWVNKRDWWDFISYDPRAPEDLRLYVERIYRDDAYIANLEVQVVKFLGEVEDLMEEIRGRNYENLRSQN